MEPSAPVFDRRVLESRTMADLQELLRRVAGLHDHLCPRQVLGVRAGLYACELLNLEPPVGEKRLLAFVETDGCFADGVSVATGCALGHRTMRLVDYGKVACTFVDTTTGRAIRVSPSPAARKLARSYVPRGERSDWQAQLDGYQVMPSQLLLQAEPVRLTISLEQIISEPGLRVLCAQCGEEIMNARETCVAGRVLCRRCAGLDSYYDVRPFASPIGGHD